MAEFTIRAAREDDAQALAKLFAAVAGEGDGIATELPVDLGERAARFARTTDSGIVAEAAGRIVGMTHIEVSRFGFGELGMLVARDWRGRGVGTALMQAGISWARERGVHKLALDVFPANAAAIQLYRNCGFVEEGRRIKHYRRSSGELWDSIVMGLALE